VKWRFFANEDMAGVIKEKSAGRVPAQGPSFSGKDVGQYLIEGLLGVMSFHVMSKVSRNPFVPLNSKAFGLRT
jgi:hypothetical protein